MALRLIVIMSWVIIFMMWLPDAWFSGACNIYDCYRSDICAHTKQTFGSVPMATKSVHIVVNALNNTGSGDYGVGNAIIYLGLVPAWGMVNAWLHKLSKWWYVALVISVACMILMGQFGFSVDMIEVGKSARHISFHKYPNWFWYCTEWCMRLADITKLTYGGVCFVVFVIAIPGVLIGDTSWGALKRFGFFAAKDEQHT